MVRNNIPCIHVHFYQFLPLKIINVCFISVIIFKQRTFLSCLRLVISHSRLRTIEDDNACPFIPSGFSVGWRCVSRVGAKSPPCPRRGTTLIQKWLHVKPISYSRMLHSFFLWYILLAAGDILVRVA